MLKGTRFVGQFLSARLFDGIKKAIDLSLKQTKK
jgi:hypothetical protein